MIDRMTRRMHRSIQKRHSTYLYLQSIASLLPLGAKVVKRHRHVYRKFCKPKFSIARWFIRKLDRIGSKFCTRASVNHSAGI